MYDSEDDDLKRNQLKEIEACVQRLGEPVEAVVLGELEEKPGRRDSAPVRRMMPWAEARRWFDIDYIKTYGSQGYVRPFYAYTRSWVIFMGHYDHSTFLVTLPRHPSAAQPVEFGGISGEP